MLSPVMSVLIVCLVSVSALAEPLVDCSKNEFRRPESARGLYTWTDGAEEKIIKAKKQGVFGVDSGTGDAVSTGYCPKMISYRGSAHCKEPGNAEYRAGLARLIRVCAEASKPVQPTGLVDCNDKRFTHAEASVDQLLSWVELALRGLADTPAHEQFQVKSKCDRALTYAGTAHCKAPTDPRTRAALAKVKKTCAEVQSKREAEKAAEAKAAQESAAAKRANRKIVPFPRRTYRGGDAAAIAGAMKRALIASPLAKSASEVLRVQPMGAWKSGRYTDTRKRYRKITGLVLWWDKDRDGVCRFVSYNFVKDHRGPLRAGSFCLGCPEGWTRCR